MAKKKPTKPEPVKLSDDQIGKLTDKLIHSRQNVYQLAESMFGVYVGEEVFEQLKAGDGGIFKCEECGEWLPVSEEDKSTTDWCSQCLDDMDAPDDEDE